MKQKFLLLFAVIAAFFFFFTGCKKDRAPDCNGNNKVLTTTSKVIFTGLNDPRGLRFGPDGNLYVAASYAGRRGVVRITPQAHAEVVLSGSGIVGLALQPSGRAIIATTGALFTLDWEVQGLPLIG